MTPGERREICTWTYQIVDLCSINRSAAVVTVSNLDRFVLCSPSFCAARSALRSWGEYQLTAMACLAIALKFWEGAKVGMDFVSRKIFRGAYGPIELKRMEADVIHALDWRLAGPTSHDFIDAIVDLLPRGAAAANDDGWALSRSLLALAAKAHTEAAMLNHQMAPILGSPIACTALLALAGGALGALLAALGTEDLAAWAGRVAATGSGGGAMDRVFAEGLAEVTRRRSPGGGGRRQRQRRQRRRCAHRHRLLPPGRPLPSLAPRGPKLRCTGAA
jgi:hypothetical protein